MPDPIGIRLDRRREVLMQRMDWILAMEKRGERPTAWFDLELLGDELAHIEDLMRTMILIAIKEDLERVAAVGSDG